MENDDNTVIVYYDNFGNVVSDSEATRFSIIKFDENGNETDHTWGDIGGSQSLEEREESAASIIDAMFQREQAEQKTR